MNHGKKTRTEMRSPADAELVGEVNRAIFAELSRRGVIKSGIAGGVGFAGLSFFAAACKFGSKNVSASKDATAASGLGAIELKMKVNRNDDPAGAPDLADMSVFVNLKDFYADYASITDVQAPFPGTDPGKAKFQARFQGTATAVLIGAWLQSKPHAVPLWNQLFAHKDEPARDKFFPKFGPAIIFQHEQVIAAMNDTKTYTVAPYSPAMNTATSNSKFGKDEVDATGAVTKAKTEYYGHYMLGTDANDIYTPDSRLSRWAVKPEDNQPYADPLSGVTGASMLERMISAICKEILKDAQPGSKIDLVADEKFGICRLAPVRVVHEYIGLPSFLRGQSGQGAFDIAGMKAGDSYPVDPQAKGIRKRYNLNLLPGYKPGAAPNVEAPDSAPMAKVPTSQDVYTWVRDAFRNIFNNFGAPMREDGLNGQQQLLAWSDTVIRFYKERMQQVESSGASQPGVSIPDTMITRLISLQLAWEGHLAGQERLTKEWFEAVLRMKVDKPKISREEATAMFADYFSFKAESPLTLEQTISKRLADDRIQANAFGTFIGAVANPEEANARIVQAVFNLKAGKLKAAKGSEYSDLVRAADVNDREKLLRFAQEFLRITPQGEVVLRFDVSAPAPIPPKLTFVAIGAAMRDTKVSSLADPDLVNVNRTAIGSKWSGEGDPRLNEEDQSQLYLTHGYGRHKCLGRYASELTMREVLRAVVAKGDWTPEAEELELYEKLYAAKLVAEFQAHQQS